MCIGCFLHILERPSLLILADQLVFQQFFEVLIRIPPNRPRRDAMFFRHRVQLLDDLFHCAPPSTAGIGTRLILPSWEGIRPMSAVRLAFASTLI